MLEPPTIEMKYGNAELRHLRGAMYLAGYAVECVLKAYIISLNPPARTLREVAPNLITAAGHNLDTLLETADLEEELGGDRLRSCNICRTWTVDWRYSPEIPKRGEAVTFVGAAQSIHQWIRAKIV